MMNQKKRSFVRSEWLWISLLLVAISALAYLPWIGKFGYYNDDWYLLYGAKVAGPSIFKAIFSYDRPGRALVMIPLYRLFGEDPLPYNISGYLFRLLGGFGFLWFVRQLWPKQRAATTIMTLLFLIYPGFLSQPNAIDYQCHLVALASATFSLALSVKAITSKGLPARLIFGIGAILSGWFYLWQMEYYIGFEAIRLLAMGMLALRLGGNWFQKGRRTLAYWLPFVIVPLVFLVWRLYFFKAERGATDVEMQFGALTDSPLVTGLWWAAHLLQGAINVIFTAWGVPFYQLVLGQQLRYTLAGLGLAGVAVGLSVLALHRVTVVGSGSDLIETRDWRMEAIWLGLLSVVAGLLPVVMVNRQVLFPIYSRYTLISLSGAVMFLAGCLFFFSRDWLRTSFVALLVAIAVMTHFANGQQHAEFTRTVDNFWWQVSWRVPQMWKGTTVVASYPVGRTEEDYFVWGPANLIYYPEGTNDKVVQPGIYAAVLNQNTLLDVMTYQPQEFDSRRSIKTYRNYRNILVISQPTETSCVRVIDGTRPELSPNDPQAVMLAASYSEIEHVLANQKVHVPPEIVFGPEPPHGWCYFYQKADLARHKQDWAEVIRLGKTAKERGLVPYDLIEWLPFLQAYMQLGDVEQLTELSPTILQNAFVAQQVCSMAASMDGLDSEMLSTLDDLYCAD